MSSLETFVHHLPSEGYFDLSHYGTITVTGVEAKKFLQGQLSCNLDEVTPTQSRLGAYCDIKGRVVALFRILQIDQQYYLIMHNELIDVVLKILGKYAVFSRVTLSTATAFTQHLGLIGNSPPTFPQTTDEVLTQEGHTIYRAPGALPRWEILVHTGATPTTSSPLQSSTGWEAHNILAGLPTLTQATSALYTTHKLGLIRLNAVSFNKGCYLGQEIVARTQYLGNLKGGLYWASTDAASPLTPQTELVDADQQLIGHIINSITLSNNTTLILAVLKQNPNETLTVTIANSSAQLRSSLSNEFT
jgi:folate-binding protein YgfZ